MKKYYSNEKHIQIVISLLKKHSIRKVVASPGGTNAAFVGSIQSDPYFEIYSSVDERSAAYIACGLAARSREPVVLSCTGATASRNYMSGLTEAFYRKLPILAITSTQVVSKVGHHVAQVIDRSVLPNDVAKLSVSLPVVKDDDDFWDCEIKVNKAILELKRHGGGPVHIDLPTIYCKTFNTKELPNVRVIDRIIITDEFPDLKGRIAVFIGAHEVMSNEATEILNNFCAKNNAVVFCDHTSNYRGKYRVLYSLVSSQQMFDYAAIRPDVLIHIGEITGDYYNLRISGKQVWRVSEDGELRDTFRKLSYVFEMSEQSFFKYYSKSKNDGDDSYLKFCNEQLDNLRKKIPELPFSNIWLASKLAHRIPDNSVIHFGILNSLRSWNFFELPQSVKSDSNVGGFGIDGNMSTLIGASLTDRKTLFFGVVGDLSFFYDMNVLGNRDIGNNLRILIVNNGKGTEFRQFDHYAAHFEEDTDKYIAAAGHFGNKSKVLVKNYVQSLGFEYLFASDKQEFELVIERFISPEISGSSMVFEIFTNSIDESNALETIMNIDGNIKGKAKQMAHKVLGKNSVNLIKKAIHS